VREALASEDDQFAKYQRVRYYHKASGTWIGGDGDGCHVVGVHRDDDPDRPYYTIQYRHREDDGGGDDDDDENGNNKQQCHAEEDGEADHPGSPGTGRVERGRDVEDPFGEDVRRLPVDIGKRFCFVIYSNEITLYNSSRVAVIAAWFSRSAAHRPLLLLLVVRVLEGHPPLRLTRQPVHDRVEHPDYREHPSDDRQEGRHVLVPLFPPLHPVPDRDGGYPHHELGLRYPVARVVRKVAPLQNLVVVVVGRDEPDEVVVRLVQLVRHVHVPGYEVAAC